MKYINKMAQGNLLFEEDGNELWELTFSYDFNTNWPAEL